MSQEKALRQLQRLSWPIRAALSFALGLVTIVQGAFVVSILFLFHGSGGWRALVSFGSSGIELYGFKGSTSASGVLVETLTAEQRILVALIAFASAACVALALFHVRQLFALYARGQVFTAGNIRHIKRFGLWLVAAAIVVSVCARAFLAVTGEPARELANPALTLVYGAMIYAIARVMELGREADLERQEFV